MKKEDLMEIKMMFLEALNEYANGGISTMSAAGDDAEEDDNELGTSGDNEEDDPENDKGKGNGNSAANSGGTPAKDGRPKPDAGVGVL